VEVSVTCEYWSEVNESAVHRSPEFPDAFPTAWPEEIVSPPSEVAVQFAPRLPFGRAKLSDALDAAKAFWGTVTSDVTRAHKVINMRERMVRFWAFPERGIFTAFQFCVIM